VLGADWENGSAGGLPPSMLQSCGTLSRRQLPSANVAALAPLASP
jgi:hypothetical protein